MIILNVKIVQLRKQKIVQVLEKFCYLSEVMRARRKADDRTLRIIKNE